MAEGRSPLSFACFALGVTVLALAGPGPAGAGPRGPLGDLPVPFVANEGQADPAVAYYARTFAGTAFVTQAGELVYGLSAPGPLSTRPPSRPGWTLTESFVGGAARPRGGRPGSAGVSAFLGSDRARWRTAVPVWEQVELGEVWPGVTVVLHARGRSVEKVFTVAPGAPVDRIRVRVAGADTLSVAPSGALRAATGLGPVTFTAPVAWQEQGGVRREVAVAYAVHGREYGFTVAAYDPGVPLLIDPLLQATYLGGGLDDQAVAVAVHPATGDVYVAGVTRSLDFPGTAGGPQPAPGGFVDAFVARLDAGLTTLLQATYLGGAELDVATALAIHPATGDVYVAGFTLSADFPGTAGGAQAVFGDGHFTLTNSTPPDAFVARLNAPLTALAQATYFGGPSAAEVVNALAIHPATGDVYAGGDRVSEVFVGPPGDARFVPTFLADGFIARWNADLTALAGSVALGTGPAAVGVHPATGEVYVAGFTAGALAGSAGGAQPEGAGETDGFVSRFSAALGGPLQSTFLGGSGADSARALAFHAGSGDVYVAGTTFSTDFPGTLGVSQSASAGGADGFVARLNSALTAITRATYLGGGSDEGVNAIAVHPATGDVYAAGTTSSTDLPASAGGAQATSEGQGDAFVARLTGDLTALVQSTYVGGSGGDIGTGVAVHRTTGDVYVAGTTSSTDVPGTGGGAQPASDGGAEAFVARFTFGLAAIDPRFADVLLSDPLAPFADALFGAGITGGCAAGPLRYCPDSPVTRGQMAVFLERGIHGAGFVPPPATGLFADVLLIHPLGAWIEALARDGVTGGCATSPPRYCPDLAVTRAAMAVFLLRAAHGAAFVPPPATGVLFADVPPIHPFADWIEQLAREGITTGCKPRRYCPDAVVTRDEMAVFLVRALELPM